MVASQTEEVATYARPLVRSAAPPPSGGAVTTCAASSPRHCDEREAARTDYDLVVVQRPLRDGTTALHHVSMVGWYYDRATVRAQADAPVTEVVERMRRLGASCCLLYSGDGTLFGIVDALDVVRHALHHGRTKNDTAAVARTAADLVSKLTVCDVRSLGAAVEHLSSGVRHMALWNAASHAHEIVSQRAVATKVHALCAGSEYADVRAALLGCEVRNAGLPSWDRRLVKVSETTTAREALRLMVAYDITSLPLVSADTGALRGVLSASDATFVDDDGSASTSLEYLARCRTARDRDPPRPVEHVVTCGTEDSLWSVLCLALAHDVHHVYVVDQDGVTPRAVVSFSDLLRWICRRA